MTAPISREVVILESAILIIPFLFSYKNKPYIKPPKKQVKVSSGWNGPIGFSKNCMISAIPAAAPAIIPPNFIAMIATKTNDNENLSAGVI